MSKCVMYVDVVRGDFKKLCHGFDSLTFLRKFFLEMFCRSRGGGGTPHCVKKDSFDMKHGDAVCAM